jgi:4-amino-4-deoxy-L-arabinose transferase-like glycosyltransferase
MIYDNNLRSRTDRKRNYLIAIIIILGFLLRWYSLTNQSIWLDEAFTIYNSQQSLSYILDQKGNTPPLYYLLLHFWIHINGNSEFSARLLSVLTGTTAIFVIYVLGSLIFNKRTGIYAALLLAISPIHIYYSQEARPYSLLFLVALLSIFFYVKLKDRFSKGSAAGYTVFSTILIYSHLYGLLVLLAQNLDQFINHNFKLRKLKSWILLQLIIIIFYIPWIIRMPEIIGVQSHSWIPKPNLLISFPLFYKFASGELNYPFKSIRKESILLFSWLLVPVIIPFLYSVIFTPVFTIRYTVVASLSLFLIAAYSLFNMNTFKKPGLLILIVLCSFLALHVQNNTTIKDPWRDVSKFIQSNMQDGDQVLLISSYEVFSFSYYFNPGCFRSPDIYKCANLEGIYPSNSIEEAGKINSERVWLILSKDQYRENMEDILNLIYDKYRVVTSREYPVNQNSAIFSKLYEYLDEKKLLSAKYNKVRVRYLKRKF